MIEKLEEELTILLRELFKNWRKRPFVLLPKNLAGKNDFEGIVYLNAQEIDVSPCDLIKMEGDQEDWLWKKTRAEIIKELEELLFRKKSFEKTIEQYFNIFQKFWREVGFYPVYCYLAVIIHRELFTTLGYKVKVMKSKELHHYFVEITDDTTNTIWIFDPAAEQFKEPFGEQYFSSRFRAPLF